MFRKFRYRKQSQKKTFIVKQEYDYENYYEIEASSITEVKKMLTREKNQYGGLSGSSHNFHLILEQPVFGGKVTKIMTKEEFDRYNTLG